MAEGKNKVIFYPSWKNVFDALNDEEAGKLIKHFCAYVNDENPEYPDRTTELSFITIKDQLKRDLDKWLKIREKRKISGSEGGKQRVANQASATLFKQNQAVNGNVTVNGNEKNNINARKLTFKESLFEYVGDYKKETVKDFFEYWSEHGDKDRKMKFEKEKSFGLSRRLSQWAKKDFNKTENPIEEKGKGSGGVSMEEMYEQ